MSEQRDDGVPVAQITKSNFIRLGITAFKEHELREIVATFCKLPGIGPARSSVPAEVREAIARRLAAADGNRFDQSTPGIDIAEHDKNKYRNRAIGILEIISAAGIAPTADLSSEPAPAVAQGARIAQIQAAAEEAIRTFCKSLSSEAVQMSHGVERIYYSGISLKGLSAAIAMALTKRAPLQSERGPDCACCEQQPRKDCTVPGCTMKDAEWALPQTTCQTLIFTDPPTAAKPVDEA